jgi:hypothetical protein
LRLRINAHAKLPDAFGRPRKPDSKSKPAPPHTCLLPTRTVYEWCIRPLEKEQEALRAEPVRHPPRSGGTGPQWNCSPGLSACFWIMNRISPPASAASIAAHTRGLAEGTGFEPAQGLSALSRLSGERHKPLGHPWKKSHTDFCQGLRATVGDSISQMIVRNLASTTERGCYRSTLSVTHERRDPWHRP